MRYFDGFLVCVLISLSVPSGTAQSRSASASVNTPSPANVRIKHDVLAEDQPVKFIFQDILRGTGVHGGFAEIAGCTDWPKGSLKVKRGSTIRQAMNALVAANPGYRWELRNGVIDLMPQGGVPLLGTRVARFQMKVMDNAVPAALQDVLV